MKTFSICALSLALLVPAIATAQEECNFETNSGTLAQSYELIGVEACTDFCSETDGCTAWLYTPHNFNPEGAPGDCRLYAEASGTREPDETAPTQYCGMVGG